MPLWRKIISIIGGSILGIAFAITLIIGLCEICSECEERQYEVHYRDQYGIAFTRLEDRCDCCLTLG